MCGCDAERVCAVARRNPTLHPYAGLSIRQGDAGHFDGLVEIGDRALAAKTVPARRCRPTLLPDAALIRVNMVDYNVIFYIVLNVVTGAMASGQVEMRLTARRCGTFRAYA